MAAVGAVGSTARLGCLVRLSTQLGRERSSERSLFKNNLRLLSHTLALITPAYDRREDDVASTPGWLLHHLSLHRLCHSTRPPPPLNASLLHLALAPLSPFPLLSRITHRPWQAFLFDDGCQQMSGQRWEHCLVFGRGGERAHCLGFCAVTSDVCVSKLN